MKMHGKKILILVFLLLNAGAWAQNRIDFSITSLNGDKIKLSRQYSKGAVFVNFWALWCKPCRNEMKWLKELDEKYSSQGLSIIGINQDTPRSNEKVRGFVESSGIKYIIALDPDKEYSDKFSVQSIPFSILFDRNGNIVYKHTGYLQGDENDLEEAIKKILPKNKK